jgi:hypothetical protein
LPFSSLAWSCMTSGCMALLSRTFLRPCESMAKLPMARAAIEGLV